MSKRIEINYLNSNKPRGQVEGLVTIHANTAFQFFSHDGPVKVKFKGNSPLATDPGELPDNTDFVAIHPGRYKYQCKIHINGHDVEFDPDNPAAIGGEMEVLPGG